MASIDAEGEGHLDSLLESSDGIVVVLDGGSRVLRISRGGRKALGYEEEEIFSLTIMALVPQDRREWMFAISKRVREDGIVSDVFVHWKTKDGRRLIAKSTLKSVVNYQHDVVGMIISEDMSAQSPGEGTMTPAQAMDMIHASEIALVVTDLSGNVVSFSSGAEKLTGFSTQQLVGSTIGRLFQEREVIGELTTKALRDGKVEDRETILVSPKDERLQVSVSVSVRRNPSGAAMGFSFVIFSIVKRKELERELEIRTEKLRLVNELATRIRSGKSMRDIYTAAVEGLSRILQFDMMTLIATTKADDGLRITSIEGKCPYWLVEGGLLPTAKGPFGTALNERKPIVYTPFELREAFPGGIPEDVGFKKGAVMPLFAGERLLGLLNFISNAPAAFGPKDMDPIVLVADHIALAVEASRLFSALMENINIQTILMETGTAVRSEMNLKEAYPLAVAKAQEVVSTNHAALYMLEDGVLKLVASDGDSKDEFHETVSKDDKNLIAAVFFGNGKAFIREVSKSDSASEREKGGYTSVMMAKLIGRSGPMGIMYLARAQTGVPFTAYEFELLNLYCNHLSPSLENAQLFENTRNSEELARKALNSERRSREALHFLVEMFAHDSLNQIQGILGYLELIGDSDIPAEVQSYLDKAMRQVRSGAYLISGTALVFKNLEAAKRVRTLEEVVKALQDAMHRFSTVFSNVEVQSRIPPLETAESEVDLLLSELFFHVLRLMHKSSGSPGIDIDISGDRDLPVAVIEFMVEAGSSSGRMLEALEDDGGQKSGTLLRLDPFIVRILSETYGTKISIAEKKQAVGNKADLVCTLEFETKTRTEGRSGRLAVR
jgi:PAS domain S-box-containing protein